MRLAPLVVCRGGIDGGCDHAARVGPRGAAAGTPGDAPMGWRRVGGWASRWRWRGAHGPRRRDAPGWIVRRCATGASSGPSHGPHISIPHENRRTKAGIQSDSCAQRGCRKSVRLGRRKSADRHRRQPDRATSVCVRRRRVRSRHPSHQRDHERPDDEADHDGEKRIGIGLGLRFAPGERP